MKALTPRQYEVLNFIKRFSAEHKMPPTRHDIARHFGWASDNAAEEHLRALAKKGAVILAPGIARGVMVA